MLITDLKQPCKNCGGNGFEAGLDEYGSLHANLQKYCRKCLGHGYVLTELGREVRTLLKPMIRDIVREELRNSYRRPGQFSPPERTGIPESE